MSVTARTRFGKHSRAPARLPFALHAARLGGWGGVLDAPGSRDVADRGILPQPHGPYASRRKAAPGVVLGLALLAAGGCGGRPGGFEKYVPPPGPARAAVAAALDAWRAGRPVGEGVGPRHDVHVVDHQRRPGQRLARYEILGEVSADNVRAFAVRLTLTDPDEEKVVRFHAVGLDPLWVFRQEDYEMIAHWMHHMDEPAEPAAPTTPRP